MPEHNLMMTVNSRSVDDVVNFGILLAKFAYPHPTIPFSWRWEDPAEDDGVPAEPIGLLDYEGSNEDPGNLNFCVSLADQSETADS